ncbi:MULTISPECIES: hypothetical protein [unclassified Agrococcus]|uniref:hypothetical protein n=1 Tax=unclassified Agrococcus TaxID=2615065 RepID=UPI00361AACCB
MSRAPLVVRGSVRHVFASRASAVLAAFGVVVLGAGILIGPVGAVIGVATLGLLAWQWRSLPRRMLVVDAPGPGAKVHHGRDGRRSVRLADVAGGIVQRTAGTTYRGIRTGATVEQWLLVGRDGRVLDRVDGRGLAADDLLAARSRIGGTWMSLREAHERGALPADAPWDLRHPRRAGAVAVAAGIATLVILLAAWASLAEVGRAAFLWPWW